MDDRLALRPAQPQDFAFCQRLYFECMGWIIQALKLDVTRHSESFMRQWRLTELRIITVAGVLRRSGIKYDTVPKENDATKVLERGQLRMDPERHACTWKNEPITLTVTEFLILQAL